MSEKVDVSKLREGDVVLVRCRVEADGSLHDIDEAGNSVGYQPFGWHRAVVSVEPRPLKVGDHVKAVQGSSEIIAISGAEAWIRHPVFGNAVRLLSDLERVP